MFRFALISFLFISLGFGLFAQDSSKVHVYFYDFNAKTFKPVTPVTIKERGYQADLKTKTLRKALRKLKKYEQINQEIDSSLFSYVRIYLNTMNTEVFVFQNMTIGYQGNLYYCDSKLIKLILRKVPRRIKRKYLPNKLN